MAMAYGEIINQAIAGLARLDQNAGDVAKKMEELKDMSDTIKGIAADPASPDSIAALVRLAEKLAKAQHTPHNTQRTPHTAHRTPHTTQRTTQGKIKMLAILRRRC